MLGDGVRKSMTRSSEAREGRWYTLLVVEIEPWEVVVAVPVWWKEGGRNGKRVVQKNVFLCKWVE